MTLNELAGRISPGVDPCKALKDKQILLRRVMALGEMEDWSAAKTFFGEDDFKKAYVSSEGGLFSPQAWAYWGLMLYGDPDALPDPGSFKAKTGREVVPSLQWLIRFS